MKGNPVKQNRSRNGMRESTCLGIGHESEKPVIPPPPHFLLGTESLALVNAHWPRYHIVSLPIEASKPEETAVNGN